MTDFKETGQSGNNYNVYSGYFMDAYLPKLQWPDVAELYDRIYRSDPEVAICRNIIDGFTNQVKVKFVSPRVIGEYTGEDVNPEDVEKQAVDFGNQVLEDMEVPLSKWLASCISRVLFYGFGYWEIVAGLRKRGWTPPDKDDPWVSNYNDGKVGIRGLRFRSYSSFYRWELNDYGRVLGFIQKTANGNFVTIPTNKAVHIKFGNTEHPEGLATLETIYRLEKIAYQLEIIQGIGFEHAAGHLDVTVEKELGEEDKAYIRNAARAIATAQQGNYALWPSGVKGEVMATPFPAAESILNAIRFYSILKLAVVNMQWATIGTISPYGTYSTMADATTFFITWFNTVVEMFTNQLDTQIGKYIYDQNLFPGLVLRPKLQASKVHKIANLIEIGQFLMSIKPLLPLTPEDWQAIRRRSEFLPEMSEADLHKAAELHAEMTGMIDVASQKNPSAPVVYPDDIPFEYKEPEPVPEPAPAQPVQETDEEGDEEDGEDNQEGDLSAQRPFVVPDDEAPLDITFVGDDLGEEYQVQVSVNKFRAWARENVPEFEKILNAHIKNSEKVV